MSWISKQKQGAEQVEIEVGQQERRLDNFLLGRFKGVPRSRIYQMIRKGEVRVNGGRVRPEYRLCRGDRVRLPPVSMPQSAAPPEPAAKQVREIRGRVLYEDSELMVLDKPAGMPVHSGTGQAFGVIDLIRLAHPGSGELQLVHRLDRDTSGCLLVAKSSACLRRLHNLLRAGRLRKEYVALLRGRLSRGAVEESSALQRTAPAGRDRMVTVAEDGKAAVSRFVRMRNFRDAALVRVEIGTGRTHQIRVHAAHLGHPLAGDDKYGDRDFNRMMRRRGLRRMFLHAARIVIPAAGDRPAVDVRAPLPEDLEEVLDACGRS
jgi:23S rRNA pseudouridine955/2504/2580 synthase